MEKEEILLEMKNTRQTNVPEESCRIECPLRALQGALQKVLVKIPLQVEPIPCYLLRLGEKQTLSALCTPSIGTGHLHL